MKKVLFMLVLIISGVLSHNVYDENVFYVNENGVEFSTKEYNKISDFYWDGYQKYMTMYDYKNLEKYNFFENNIESNIYEDIGLDIIPLVEHTTQSKSLKMSKSCSDVCMISLTLTWKKTPTIKSYDLLGVYLDDTSLISASNVIVETDKGSTSHNITKTAYNGLATSFKLDSNLSALRVSQTLVVEKKGSINGSYQHAKKNITYSNSQKFSFSKSGIGGVFNFNTGIQNYYDCMLGVKLNLS